MKKNKALGLILILIFALTLPGCGSGSSGSGSSGGGGTTPEPEDPTMSVSESLVPGAASFPTDSDDSKICTTVNYPYYMAQTEVTYELWRIVYRWATSSERGTKKYAFAHAGAKGSSGTGSDQEPVTMITYRDAFVWCNALTEYYNAKHGTNYKCVYYNDASYKGPFRNAKDSSVNDPYFYAAAAGNQDMTLCSADGFRLPTNAEWDLAARYRDGTAWTSGSYASGAAADYTDSNATGAVAWYEDNSGGSTHPVGQKSPNALGLYDMSGNVCEWCTKPSSPIGLARGGCWNSDAYILKLGVFHVYNIETANATCGIRPVRKPMN